MDNIYVSIASYRDLELTDTVYSLLSKAKDPTRIFVSVFSQDETHPDLENLFNLFKVEGFVYDKVHFSEAKGVGYARTMTHKNLSTKFKYHLQIDSHTRFIKDWDNILIEQYNNSCTFWNSDIIFSSYPIPYTYDDNGNEKMNKPIGANIAKMQNVKNNNLYTVNYEDRVIDEYGEWHGHFCAGFVFGLSEHFLKVPYDPFLYFYGEEHLMSIRMFCNNIKVIAPPRTYVYHHYYGENTRIKHWESQLNWGQYQELSLQRIKMFFDFKKLGGYGMLTTEKYKEWEDKFIIKEVDQ